VSDQGDPLARIADALERLAPDRRSPTDWLSAPAYSWSANRANPVAAISAPPLAVFRGIDRQRDLVVENVARLAEGHAAHDMLLWGARGMGKSALIRSAVATAQAAGANLGLVQLGVTALEDLPRLFYRLAGEERHYLIFIDDLAFAEDDAMGPRLLRSWLEGGVDARPANTRLAVTTNRRSIVARKAGEAEDAMNERDMLDDKLALADRFGLSIGFHPCSKGDYLAIVRAYADPRGLTFEDGEALAWAMQRGARSGRTAWQFVTELAGRAGQTF
jgi:predicted AAA+ superfamily ATPase